MMVTNLPSQYTASYLGHLGPRGVLLQPWGSMALGGQPASGMGKKCKDQHNASNQSRSGDNKDKHTSQVKEYSGYYAGSLVKVEGYPVQACLQPLSLQQSPNQCKDQTHPISQLIPTNQPDTFLGQGTKELGSIGTNMQITNDHLTALYIYIYGSS